MLGIEGRYKITLTLTIDIKKEEEYRNNNEKQSIKTTDRTDSYKETKLLTINELTKELNIGKNKAYELINTGKIKSIKIGRKIRIPKKAIIEFIENENK